MLHILWRSPRKCPVEFGLLLPRVHVGGSNLCKMRKRTTTTRQIRECSRTQPPAKLAASFATDAECWDYPLCRTWESYLKIFWAQHLWEKALALEVPLLPVDEEMLTAQTFHRIYLTATYCGFPQARVVLSSVVEWSSPSGRWARSDWICRWGNL